MMARGANPRSVAPLEKRLALFSFLSYQFGIPVFDRIKGAMMDSEEKSYIEIIRSREELDSDVRKKLDNYAGNIHEHTERIGEKRGGLHWKYFQWLILMFSERYLDLWFNGTDDLLRALDAHRQEKFPSLPRYSEDDLRKLALWSATGSGKTLMMHINLLQFRHYLEQHGRERDITQQILLVPNDGLAQQHCQEFRDSGIAARIFDKAYIGDLRRGEVEIVSIHKIRDDDSTSKAGETVPVGAFESKNLVMIDEGHRGHSGDKWLQYRSAMTGRGFSFEYSATFGQIKDAQAHYAHNILFDYSYKHFYDDGYGKDHRIFNLHKVSFENRDDKRKYLTACLLAFYLQMRTYESDDKWQLEHNIEKPLLIFVGARVNAVYTERSEKVSDVLDTVRFLHGILNNAEQTKADIRDTLRDDNGLRNERGEPIFGDMFSALPNDPGEIYTGLLRGVFQSDASAPLHMARISDADGEIALYAGVGEPFGVINIGDAPAFLNLCRDKIPDTVADDRNFSGSLFRRINEPNSRINILIGSKKFTEGWNSWRVSTMGLLNVGKSEGTEIIQLFGRGIRLRGKNNDLKREESPSDSETKTLETLNIFGLQANFIANFKEYLRTEGLGEQKIYDIRVDKDKILDSKDFPIIDTEKNEEAFREEVTVCVRYARDLGVDAVRFAARMLISSMTSEQESESDMGKPICIPPQYKAFFDRTKIREALHRHKRTQGWHNLILDDDLADDLLRNDEWYKLYGDPSDEQGLCWEKMNRWQTIATDMMKQYITNFRKNELEKWTKEHRHYKTLLKSHDNFIKGYEVRVNELNSGLMASLEEIMRNGKGHGGITAERSTAERSNLHLYEPLLALRDDITPRDARIIPNDARLNKGELEFLHNLVKWWDDNKGQNGDMEIFLLRNRSRGHGVGFIEVGFYPDFIMWLFKDNRRHIVFIDPKGGVHLDSSSDKVEFGKRLKNKIAPALKERSKPKFSNCYLHFFLILQTNQRDMERRWRVESPSYVLYSEDRRHIEEMISQIVRA